MVHHADRIEAAHLECRVGVAGHVAIAIAQPCAPLVQPRELAGDVVQALALVGVRVRRQVEGPAREPRHRLVRVARRAIRQREQRRFLELAHLAGDDVAVGVRVHRVEHERRVALEPADVGHRAAARHDADEHALLRLPRVGRRAAHRALHRTRQRHDGEQHVLTGDEEVVHHRRIGRAEGLGAHEVAGLVDHVERHVVRQHAVGVVAEEQHLARLGVDLRVRRHRADELAAEGVRADRRERAHVEFDGRVRFLQREQAVAVPHDVGVREAVGLLPEHARVCIHRVHRAEQRAARVVFLLELLGAHPAVAVRHLAVRDVEAVQHAVAREQVIVAARCELRVRAVAQEHAAKLGGDLALHHQVGRIALHPQRLEATDEVLVIREGCRHLRVLLVAGRRPSRPGVKRWVARPAPPAPSS